MSCAKFTAGYLVPIWFLYNDVLSNTEQHNFSFVASVDSPRNTGSSGMKPRIARVPSAKLRSSMSMDFSNLQGIKGLMV